MSNTDITSVDMTSIKDCLPSILYSSSAYYQPITNKR